MIILPLFESELDVCTRQRIFLSWLSGRGLIHRSELCVPLQTRDCMAHQVGPPADKTKRRRAGETAAHENKLHFQPCPVTSLTPL